ncbi:hypothetical protein B0H19DRAFT_942619, partial [Mycena capillaripes]
LPEIMPSYGKLRIVDGDSIRSASACGDGPERNMSFIRVSGLRRRQTDSWISQIFYGRLEHILLCALPSHTKFGSVAGKTCLLAVVTPCNSTGGKDASKEITKYRKMGASLVMDLQSVVAVVGRVETRGSWVIVDRTGGFIRPEFVPDDEEPEVE